MKTLRILSEILRRTHADKILIGFMVFMVVDAAIIWLAEPDIPRYVDSLWYCYVAAATIGFGDFAAKTLIGRIATIILSLYATLVIAIVTGVIANFFMEIIELRKKETLTNLMDRLENLPEMSKEELQEISDSVKHFRQN